MKYILFIIDTGTNRQLDIQAKTPNELREVVLYVHNTLNSKSLNTPWHWIVEIPNIIGESHSRRRLFEAKVQSYWVAHQLYVRVAN